MQVQLWGGPADGTVMHVMEACIEYVTETKKPSATDEKPVAVYKPWHRIEGGILYRFSHEEVR